MTNANAANITRSESIAVDVITAKGAALKRAGFWAAVCPLIERAYRHGNDKEQWTGKCSSARPLRSCWAAAFIRQILGNFQLLPVPVRFALLQLSYLSNSL